MVAPVRHTDRPPAAGSTAHPLQVQVETYIEDLFSRFLDIDVEDLRSNVTFDQYGLESVMAINITTELEQDFGELSATLLFEHQTIDSLCQYLLEQHRQVCAKKCIPAGGRRDQRAIASEIQPVPPAKANRPGDNDSVRDKLEGYIKDMFSQYLQIDVADLNSEVTFETYGLESVMAVNITDRLEQDFGSLSPTLLFEHQSIEQLSGYFIEQYPVVCQSLFSGNLQTAPAPVNRHAYDVDISGTTESSVNEMPNIGGTEQHGYDNIVDVRGAVASLSDEEVDRLLCSLSESA